MIICRYDCGLDHKGQECHVCKHQSGGPYGKLCRKCNNYWR